MQAGAGAPAEAVPSSEAAATAQALVAAATALASLGSIVVFAAAGAEVFAEAGAEDITVGQQGSAGQRGLIGGTATAVFH